MYLCGSKWINLKKVNNYGEKRFIEGCHPAHRHKEL